MIQKAGSGEPERAPVRGADPPRRGKVPTLSRPAAAVLGFLQRVSPRFLAGPRANAPAPQQGERAERFDPSAGSRSPGVFTSPGRERSEGPSVSAGIDDIDVDGVRPARSSLAVVPDGDNGCRWTLARPPRPMLARLDGRRRRRTGNRIHSAIDSSKALS